MIAGSEFVAGAIVVDSMSTRCWAFQLSCFASSIGFKSRIA